MLISCKKISNGIRFAHYGRSRSSTWPQLRMKMLILLRHD